MKHTSKLAAPPRVSELLKTCVENIHGLTQERLADALSVSRHTVNELFNDKRSITPLMALKLAHVLDTDAELWLNIQRARDLFEVQEEFERSKSSLEILRRDQTLDHESRRAAG